MNSIGQHIAILILVVSYFTWGDKDLWVKFIAINAVIGIIFSLFPRP